MSSYLNLNLRMKYILTTETQSKKNFKMKFPNVFVILFSLIIIMAILTYIIPAGEFERTTDEHGTSVVVEGTYKIIESSPAGIQDIFLAIPEGMIEGASIIFFILIVGGAFGILLSTNVIGLMVNKLAYAMKNKTIYTIPILMIFFGLGGATFGMSEETIPFMLIIIPLAIRLGFDSMVGAGIVIIGAHAGFTAAFFNPFTVGIAQEIAGLPLFSGLALRIVYWFIFMGVSIAFVMLYARKIQKNPQLSLTYHQDKELEKEKDDSAAQESLTPRHILVMITLVLTLVCLAIGVISFDWYTNEIAALFLFMGIVVGFISKMSLNQMADNFIKGCQELTSGAIIVGFAYAVLIILEDSNTIDTILNYSATLVGNLPNSFTAIGMYATQSFLNYLVPSGSGQAALTMPIMAPLGDLVGVSRQTAVLAFQLGDGISNIVTPTSGAFMAALAIAKISWVKWMKWFWPLMVIHYILGAIFVTVAHVFVW